MLIERLKVKGLLSFGPDGIDLPLEPLNVLIGPNGSGKSNLLYVLGLLRDTDSRDGHGLMYRTWSELLWNGPPHIDYDTHPRFVVAATVTLPEWEESLAYSLETWQSGEINVGPRETISRINESGDAEALPDDDGRALRCLHRKFGGLACTTIGNTENLPQYAKDKPNLTSIAAAPG